METAIFKYAETTRITLTPPATPPVGQYPSGQYPDAPVHMGVHYSTVPVLGSKLWLVMSPYPGFNDDYENPCVYRSDDSLGESIPSTFIPYSANPLVGKIGDPGDISFNADPDIITHEGKVYVLNRPWQRATAPSDLWVEYFESTDDGAGNLTGFTTPVRLYTAVDNVINSLGAGSPAIVFWNNNFRIYDLITASWNSVDGYCYGMRIMDSPTMGLNSHSSYTFGRFYGYKLEPWHMSVFEHAGKLYSIMCAKTRGYNGQDSGRIYLGEFDSTGTDLYIHRKPLTDFNSYRGDAYIDDDGNFILYSINYPERSVRVSSIPFDELLNKVRV